jgi:hypothetical protein
VAAGVGQMTKPKTPLYYAALRSFFTCVDQVDLFTEQGSLQSDEQLPVGSAMSSEL